MISIAKFKATVLHSTNSAVKLARHNPEKYKVMAMQIVHTKIENSETSLREMLKAQRTLQHNQDAANKRANLASFDFRSPPLSYESQKSFNAMVDAMYPGFYRDQQQFRSLSKEISYVQNRIEKLKLAQGEIK